MDRRQFLSTAAVATALAGHSTVFPGFAANDTISVGCIGTGGRCRQLMQALSGVPGVEIAAVCDIWETNLAEGAKLASPRARQFRDHRALVDQSEIDAVVIGAPDHHHVPITIDACAAGKDVYVEKPLTHSLGEGAAVVEAQNKHRRIVQVGMQQRSMPHIQEARELVQQGLIGDVHKVHLSWNRNTPRWQRKQYGIDPASVDWTQFLGSAPEQPFDEYKFRNWRWFWDFGGGIFTDLMVHWIDVAHWFLGVDHPAVAVSIGDHMQAEGVWETPDTVQTLLRYPDRGVQAYFEGTFCNARNRSMIEFMGTKGTLYIDRGRYEVHPDPHQDLQSRERILGTEPRGADFFSNPNGELLHLSNWIDCCRSRKTPNAPAEAGVSAAAAAHLANIALREMKVAHWS